MKAKAIAVGSHEIIRKAKAPKISAKGAPFKRANLLQITYIYSLIKATVCIVEWSIRWS